MQLLAYLILALYILVLTSITVYSFFQLQLLFAYRFRKKNLPKSRAALSPSAKELPLVTIQLPIFNERYVVERLLDCICSLNYPKECLQIQVLDDSTDETRALVAEKVAQYQAAGFAIEQLHRSNRQGFKAGALRDAMPAVRGQFIAIFDADFLPKPDFLLQSLPYFEKAEVGVVQTRWEHLNYDYSLLTRLQAIQLDVHFTVEQKGRLAGGYFLQFNGTAGLWRKSCIEAAGGWEADTLTEDLDLSYRAQLAGWKVLYLENITAPAELPVEMQGLKSQQFRWTKGGAETARKLLPRIWKSPISFSQKLHASVHLLGSSVFVLALFAALLSVPAFFLQDYFQHLDLRFMLLFYSGFLALLLVYYTANVGRSQLQLPYWRRVARFVLLFPAFFALVVGLSLHNSVAVIQGYRGKKSPFVRTPKFNIRHWKDSFQQKAYRGKGLDWVTWGEGFLGLYFLMSGLLGLYWGNTSLLPFHATYALGFGGIFIYTWRHRYK